MKTILLCSTVLFLSIACRSQSSTPSAAESEGPPERGEIEALDSVVFGWVTVGDLQTAVVGSTVTATVSNGGTRIDSEQLGAFAKSLRLRTYPGLVDVPFQVSGWNAVVPEAAQNLPEKDTARDAGTVRDEAVVTLTAERFADGWYVVDLPELPPRWRLRGAPLPRPAVALGQVFARFSADRIPTFTHVLLCQSGGDRVTVRFGFSEPVIVDTAAHARVIAYPRDNPAGCSSVPLAEGADRSAKSLDKTCLARPDGEWVVGLQEGLRTEVPGGIVGTIGGTRALEVALRWADLQSAGPKCRVWYPEALDR